MSTSIGQTVAQLRCELGELLHIDWSQRRILCERGDLVRDLEVEDVNRQGREVRVPPELWSAYQDVVELPPDERPPITTWAEVCSILGISTSTLNRHRRKANDATELPFASEAAVRKWWRNLALPAGRRRKQTNRPATTLDTLTAGRS